MDAATASNFEYVPPTGETSLEAHGRLVDGYLWAIQQASLVETKRSAARASFVRLAVGGQIKAKLAAASDAYVQLANASANESERDELELIAERSRGLAATLRSFNFTDAARFVSKLTIPAAALVIFSAVKDLASSSAAGGAVGIFISVVYLIGLAAVTLVMWRASFLRKRQLLLGSDSGQEGASGPNVYELEDELFSLLSRKKQEEAQLDLWIEGSAIFGIGFLAFIDPFRWTEGVSWHQWVLGSLFALGFLLWLGLRVNAATNRKR